MPTQQGDVALLDDPVAQRLLQSPAPARLAYVWTDGTPAWCRSASSGASSRRKAGPVRILLRSHARTSAAAAG